MPPKRKYNPNKLLNIQRAKAGELYEFEMQFCIEDVNTAIDQYRNLLIDALKVLGEQSQ